MSKWDGTTRHGSALAGEIPAARYMTRILFVDDDQRLLDGLRRSLHVARSEWEMQFVCGAADALKALGAAPFDVIVTDIRMPGIGGEDLLKQVMERYPDLLRIILSGESDSSVLVRSAGVAHQYLSKPCSADDLKATVNRAVSLRRFLQDQRLREILSRIDALPSAPPLYLEIVRLLDSPYTSLEQVGRVIARDMAMCAKVLQLANSAFFGHRQAISSPAEAAALLGFNMLKTLSLAVHIFKMDSAPQVAGYRLDELWQHSLKVSLFAERIAQSLAPGRQELSYQAQVAGLLHDVGRLVMARNVTDRFKTARDLSASQAIPLLDAEKEVFGVSHAELGAYILALWGLPEAVVQAVAFHHSPDQIAGCAARTPIAAVHAADTLANAQSKEEADENVRYLAALYPELPLAGWMQLAQSVGAGTAFGA